MMDKKACILAILVIFGLAACAGMQSGTTGPYLPNDIKIIPPSPDLPKNIAAFSGKWVGRWGGGGIEMILVVEEIHDTWAQVVYSRGNDPDTVAGHFRVRCKVISDPKPNIVVERDQVKSKGDLYFEVKDSNTLEGFTTSQWGRLIAILDRVN